MRFFLPAFLVIVAPLAPAQSAPFRPPSTLNRPYFVELETKREQTLADGTHIVQVTRQKRYRDSQGRIRMEFYLNSDVGQSPRTNVNITDLAAGQTMSWMVGDHMESVYTVGKILVATPSDGIPRQSVPASSQQNQRPQQTQEPLGMQDVQGISCKATRITTIFPVGMIGNDRPVTVVSEHCMSQELGLELSGHVTDPRSGTTTTTVISINRMEPDAALFRPPAGFSERRMVDSTAAPTSGQ
ncbi:hypothetical protein [Terriglobus sp. TAA 43]|uniref:hypothetical protein n=1 Tax=Terriglobus sp. TAA 43 TaxID=278961 RepID=UPI0012EE13E4|nr:hypothetical protein [Terriglobus sp. TAA 43]